MRVTQHPPLAPRPQ